MKTLSALVVAAGIAAVAGAQPLVIEETSRFSPPPGADNLWGPLAIDGGDAVAVGTKDIPDPNGFDDILWTAYLYRRSGTSWNYVRKLAEWLDDNEDDAHTRGPVAMKGGVMNISFSPGVFERENGDWVNKPVNSSQGSPGGAAPPSEVAIDGGRIFVGDGPWGGTILEKDTSSGSWIPRYGLSGDYSGDSDNAVGGDVDISPNWAAVADPYNDDGLPAPAVHIFQRVSGGGWPLNTRLVAPAGHSFGDVVIRDTEMYIGDYARFGAGVWRRDSAGQWYVADRLRTASDFDNIGPFDGYGYGNEIQKSDTFVVQHAWNAERGQNVINVFQPVANGSYRHVAILAAHNGEDVGRSLAVSGRSVIAQGTNGPVYFELPASFDQPSLFQETFSTGDGAGWSPIPGSQFSVVQSGASRVYRQSSTAGDAGAVLDANDWTNESIQADVTPTAVNGADRWVGLATRRTDASNFYYVTLRSSGVVQLKRIQGGTITMLASAKVSWALHRTYRLRLESIGTLQRVYVNGVPMVEAWDGALSHGHAALLSYRAAADYDNVVVSPFLTQAIYDVDQGQVYSPPQLNPEPWEYSGNGSWQWAYQGTQNLFLQTSTAGDARAAVGQVLVEDADQAVQARVTPRAFGAGDPWFGLMARYANPSNYLYLTVRKSNLLMLRKLVNGNIVQLGSVPFTVAANTTYTLRLEAVGTAVRAYFNGRLVLEARDPHRSNGRVGLVTFRTAADYDDIRAATP